MNLIQQFPDVSEERRNRLKGNQKRSRTKLPVGSAKDNDARLVQAYDHEFKKSHSVGNLSMDHSASKLL